MIWKVRIPPVSWEQARIWNAKTIECLKALGKDRSYTEFDYTNVPEAFVFGYVGETGFRDWLWCLDKRWYYRAHPDGKSHGADLHIWKVDGTLVKVDVKCGSRPHYEKLIVPEWQFLRDRRERKIDVYVGLRLMEEGDSEWGQLMGWITFGELNAWYKIHGADNIIDEKRKARTRSLRFPYSELRDMGEMLEKLMDAPKHFLLEEEAAAKIVPALPVEHQGVLL